MARLGATLAQASAKSHGGEEGVTTMTTIRRRRTRVVRVLAYLFPSDRGGAVPPPLRGYPVGRGR
jgi:hypothetical protein